MQIHSLSGNMPSIIEQQFLEQQFFIRLYIRIYIQMFGLRIYVILDKYQR